MTGKGTMFEMHHPYGILLLVWSLLEFQSRVTIQSLIETVDGNLPFKKSFYFWSRSSKLLLSDA
jgi:hypothetical protein